MMNLPDGGLLGHQLAVAPAQVGDVAQQDQRPDPLALGPQRDRAHDEHHVVGADLGVAGCAAQQHGAERLLVGAVHRRHQRPRQGGQLEPGEVAAVPEPAVDRQCVGAGVLNPTVVVDPQEPVADPRRVGVVAALARVGEVARTRSSG